MSSQWSICKHCGLTIELGGLLPLPLRSGWAHPVDGELWSYCENAKLVKAGKPDLGPIPGGMVATPDPNLLILSVRRELVSLYEELS